MVEDGDILSCQAKEYFDRISKNMDEADTAFALHMLSEFLSRYHNKKVIILLDEYDTPMQEASVNGFWDLMAGFIRQLFNATWQGVG